MHGDAVNDYLANRRLEFAAERAWLLCIECGARINQFEPGTYDVVTVWNSDGSVAADGAMCAACLEADESEAD